MIPARLQSLIRPLASLYLTVLLLSLGLLLVFSGTLAQMHDSVWSVEREYFHSFFVLAEFELFELPMPGGWIVGGLLLVNLLAAFITRFELSRKRAGIILLHLGILVLIVGELLRGVMAVEMQMQLEEGQSSNWTYQLHEPELAIINPLADEDNELAIDSRMLGPNRRISGEDLPFDIEILAWHRHAVIEPGPGGGAISPRKPSVRNPDMNAAELLVRGPTGQPQLVNVGMHSVQDQQPVRARVDIVDEDGREQPYFLELRFRRHYQPFTFYLHEFVHEQYEGSDIPKRFSSEVQLIDPERDEDRRVLITMNHPLRYRGLTFYQAMFRGAEVSILQVVDNPAWLGPYIGCGLVALGMLYHFILKLLEFQRRLRTRRSRAAAQANAAPALGPEGVNGRQRGPWFMPTLALLAGALILGMSWQRGALETEPYNIAGLAELPVRHDGRTKPLDSAARALLHRLSDRATIRHEGERLGPTAWYLRTAADYHRRPVPPAAHNLRPWMQGFFADWSDAPAPEAVFGRRHPDGHSFDRRLIEHLLDPEADTATLDLQRTVNRLSGVLKSYMTTWRHDGPDRHERVLEVDREALDSVAPGLGDGEGRVSLAELQPHLPALYAALLETFERFETTLGSEHLGRALDDLAEAEAVEPETIDRALANLSLQLLHYPQLLSRERMRSLFAGLDTHRILPLIVDIDRAGHEQAPMVQHVLLSPDDTLPIEQVVMATNMMRHGGRLGLFLIAYADRGWGIDVPVFRIDNPQVRGLVGAQDDRQTHFSLRELQPALGRLFVEGNLAMRVAEEHREPFHRDVVELFNKVVRYGTIRFRYDLQEVVPLEAEHGWDDMMEAPADHPSVKAWETLLRAWAEDDAETFNHAIRQYRDTLADPDLEGARQRAEMDRIDNEMLFNRLQPFAWAAAKYAIVMLLGMLSWLGWSEPLRRSAMRLALLVLLYHTAGLALRVYIHGQPPVTSLYASAIFVGWAGVILSLVLERYYRNALGVVCAGVLGFTTLRLAQGISAGDDFEAVQAVLNTPFWLTTHVLTVAIGYGAMFLAGAMGIIFILGGLLTPAINRDWAQTITRMIYGTLCFALLFTFVGTLLGGLWADQSWGRFWGWDPKENGALMIVIVCAIALHARFCGMIQQRGLAAMAVLGNIVTAWAWFGVNLLGIGLHSYGFMEGGFEVLLAFAGSQIAIIALAAVPPMFWKSPGISGR